MSFLLIYITHPDEPTARRIGDTLVAERLAACANYFPITSAYWWKGDVQSEQEWVSIVKTRPERWLDIQRAVQALHPYEVPCIMRMEVSANEAYEHWIMENS